MTRDYSYEDDERDPDSVRIEAEANRMLERHYLKEVAE